MTKRVALAFLVTLVLAMVAGCGGTVGPSVFNTDKDPLAGDERTVDLSVGETRGNHTWLPINRKGKASDMAVDILELVATFEEAHSNLEVFGFNIEKQQIGENTSEIVFGIWLHHRVRE